MIQSKVNTNPFPGLRPFNEDEDYLFFGRESQVDELINKLSANKFLAVIGTSGSGKSSLVNCGLFPALHGGYMTSAGSGWSIAKFRPGTDPIQEMALALAQKNILFTKEKIGKIPLSSIILTNLQRSKLGLVETYKQARLSTDDNLLIVVDQFEELFRYKKLRSDYQEDTSDHLDKATAFVNLILTAANQSEVPIYVVITMRSDFLGDCSAFRGLPEAINKGQYLVPRMKRRERRKAIEGPIEVAGGRLTERLLMRLVNDVGDNPDQLSILQHALNRTWAEWEKDGNPDQPIDLEHYNKIGTMSAALDQHAERAYRELETARAKKICEKMFKALTDVGFDSRGVRRPTKLGTLCEIIEATEEEATAVIDVFRKPSRSFLMPPADRPLNQETIIDISHESLMRIWKRLMQWTEDEQESVRNYKRLSDSAMLFKEGKSSLLGDPDLQFALNWKKKEKPNPTWASRYDDNYEEVISFLDQSKENWLKEEEEKKTKAMLEERRKEEEQKRKEEEQRKKIKRARQMAIIVGIAAIICLGFAIYGFMQRSYAMKQKEIAEDKSIKLEENEVKIAKFLKASGISGISGDLALDKIIKVSTLQDSIQQLEREGTTDAVLLSLYDTLVNGYQDILNEDSISSFNNKISLLGSFDQLMKEDKSKEIPIGWMLNDWKGFVSYPRNTVEMDTALAKINAYERKVAGNASISREDDFLTLKNLNGLDYKVSDTASSFKTNKQIYLWAKLDLPGTEILTVKWLHNGTSFFSAIDTINISGPVQGYRFRHQQSYNSNRTGDNNEVRLYNGDGELIGRKVFEIIR